MYCLSNNLNPVRFGVFYAYKLLPSGRMPVVLEYKGIRTFGKATDMSM